MQQWLTDLYDHAMAVITILGGAGVVAAVVANFLSKLVADRSIEKRKSELNGELERLKADLGRESERFKTDLAREADSFRFQLKKRELLFNKELETASAFMKLRRQILPGYDHPDMDWVETCRIMANDFGKHEISLYKFMVEHGVILSSPLLEKLSCCDIASNYKFEGLEADEMMSCQARQKANNLLETLKEIENRLIDEIRSWEDKKSVAG